MHDAAAKLPEPLKSRMLKLSTSIDKSVLALAHDPGPGGKGFVVFADPTTLRPTEYWIYKEDLEKGKPPRRIPYTGGWRSAYIGQYPHTKVTPAMMLRYAQTGNKDYRRLLLACADNFLTSEPDLKPQKDANGKPLPLPDVEAGTIGSVMELLNWAYRETKEAKYLDRSVWFGEWALSHYWTDGLPLPRATVRENIYSAPSRSDTLVMALLDAWMLANPTAKTYPLIPTDR